MICPHCQQEHPSQAQFCPFTGRALVPASAQLCPRCQSPINAEMQFCPQCQHTLKPHITTTPKINKLLGLMVIVSFSLIAMISIFFMLGSSWRPTSAFAQNSSLLSSATIIPTNTAFATATSLPATTTPTPTHTALPTRPSVSTTPTPNNTYDTTTCTYSVARWFTASWSANATTLGCPTSNESYPDGAYQDFSNNATMIWEGYTKRIFILYGNGILSSQYDVAPQGYRSNNVSNMKGGFGYIWDTQPNIRSSLGTPLGIEFNTQNLVIQFFQGGAILSFNQKGSYTLDLNILRWRR